MAGLVFLLVFWELAGACQRHGVGGVIVVQLIIITARPVCRAEIPGFAWLSAKRNLSNTGEKKSR